MFKHEKEETVLTLCSFIDISYMPYACRINGRTDLLHSHDQLIAVLVHSPNHPESKLFGTVRVKTGACTPYQHPLQAIQIHLLQMHTAWNTTSQPIFTMKSVRVYSSILSYRACLPPFLHTCILSLSRHFAVLPVQ